MSFHKIAPVKKAAKPAAHAPKPKAPKKPAPQKVQRRPVGHQR
ncbi:hypothetical protein GCM10023084_15970 [Streptomyces lacrimifluminis]|uniref:Uncharacterized protein n=1 Tax=Streptomyces lacrimifluminis TaxID=1500077 RepID=A0A917KE16_9ACTN|nr:hypothetical protein [Streptomyces lacrimifluminis]GGJ07566.1 hypothetical protein GCM10012282_00350 [Streptomyces lacrimifluminis]